MKRILAGAILALLLTSFPHGMEDEKSPKNLFLNRKVHNAAESVSFRHMEAGTISKNLFASMDVETKLARGLFSYRVTSESGSGMIRNHVFRQLLDDEGKETEAHSLRKSGFTQENYKFQEAEALADADIWKMAIDPKRKERFLISGFLLVGPEGELYSSKGSLVRSPTFWTKNVIVSIDYREFSGTVVPIHLDSFADVRFVGKSFLTTDYT